MALTEPSLRRLRPVRLTELPLDVRIEAATRLARYAHDGDEAQALFAAALAPSNTVYFVTLDALRSVAA